MSRTTSFHSPSLAASRRPYSALPGKRFSAPVTAVLLAVLLGACSSGQAGSVSAPAAPASSAVAEETAPAATPAAPVEASAVDAPAVGTPFTADMGNGNIARITVLSAVRTDTVSTTLGTPAKNGSYLLLDVLWETEAGETSSNPFYFSAKDAEGRSADLDMFADGQLGSGQVLPGDKSRGFIAFDVAPGPVTVSITDPLMQEAARIDIPG